MPAKKYIVRLSGEEREQLEALDSPYKPMQLLKINGLLVWEQ